jgi:hypothetical protein
MVAPVGLALGAVLLAACGASAEKFSSAAEDFIEGEEVATWGQQEQFVNAICNEPASTDVNTTFQCTADGSDTHSYVFQVVIVGERKFRIESLQPQN